MNEEKDVKEGSDVSEKGTEQEVEKEVKKPEEEKEGGKSSELEEKPEKPITDDNPDDEEEDEGESELEEDDIPYHFYTSTLKYERTGPFTGLSNQGATCYLNSLLQSMYMTPEIRSKLFNWRYDKDVHGSEDRSIPLQLQRLFGKLQLTKKRSVSTEKLTKSFGWNRTQAFVQHDVNELCRVLFDALDKTFAPNLYKKNEALKKCKTEEETKKVVDEYADLCTDEVFISDMYRGELVDYVLAKDMLDKEGNEIGRKRNDNYLDIQLVIRNMKSVSDAMRNFVTPEVLDGDNQWFCEQLDKKVDAIKGLKFARFPPILTLNLKRFDYNPITWTREKLGHRVSFPFVLDVGEFMQEGKKEGEEEEESMGVEGEKDACSEYELFSVLIHSGNARMGHYYAYIKAFEDGKWYKFNDQDVKEIDESQVKKMFGSDEQQGQNSTNAYMLMYRNLALDRVKEIPNDVVPEDIRTKILEKNEKVAKLIEYNAQRKMFVVCRFYTFRRDHIDTCRVKRAWTIERLTRKLHERLSRKYPQHYGEDTAVPLDSFRLREMSHYTSRGRNYVGREKKTLKELRISRVESFIIETKPKEKEWRKEIVYLDLYVNPLFPGNEEFGHYTQTRIVNTATAMEFRTHVADMFRRSVRRRVENEDLEVDGEHIALYLLDRKGKKIIVVPREDDDKKLESELGWCDCGDVFVELFVDKPRGEKILYDDHFTYLLKHNLLGKETFTETIRVSQFITVAELKTLLSKRLGKDEKELSIFNMGYHGRRKFSDYTDKLKNTMLYDNSKILITDEKPLEKDEFEIPIWQFTPLHLVEAKEKARGEEASKRREELQKLAEEAEKENESESDVAEATGEVKEGDAAAAADAAAQEPGAAVDEAKEETGETEKKTETEQKETETEKESEESGTEVKEVEEKEKKDGTKTTEEENKENTVQKEEKEGESDEKEGEEESEEEKRDKALVKQMIDEDKDDDITAFRYQWKEKKQFDYLCKMVVGKKEKVADLRKKLVEKLKKKKGLDVKPNQFFIRGTRYYKLLNYLKADNFSVGEQYPYFDGDAKLCILLLDKEVETTLEDAVVKIIQWDPTNWVIKPFVRHVHKAKMNIKDTVCEFVGCKEEDIWVYMVGKGIDLNKRKVGTFKWEEENFSGKRVFDDMQIIWCYKKDKPKYDVKRLAKHIQKINPSDCKGYVKEQALVIETEFDAKKKKKGDEKKDEDQDGENKEKAVVIHVDSDGMD